MSARLQSFVVRVLRWEFLLVALAVLLVWFSATTTDGFWTGFNLSTSTSAMSEKALMALPLTLLIIAREIDISIASIAALSATAMGLSIQSGSSLAVAVVVALVVGALCGLVNGLLVAVLGLPSLIVTLGTLALFRGLCYVLLGSLPITELPRQLVDVANGNVPGTYVPWVAVPFLALLPGFWILLHRSPTGRRIYALGGSPVVADYSGVHGRRLRLGLFVVTGVVCAVAGVMVAGRTSQVSPDAALGFELDVITVVFLGGVSVLGGRGRLDGVVIGLLLVIAVRSVLQLNNVSGYAQGVAVGVLLLVSLLLSSAVSAARARAIAGAHRARAGPGAVPPPVASVAPV